MIRYHIEHTNATVWHESIFFRYKTLKEAKSELKKLRQDWSKTKFRIVQVRTKVLMF